MDLDMLAEVTLRSKPHSSVSFAQFRFLTCYRVQMAASD